MEKKEFDKTKPKKGVAMNAKDIVSCETGYERELSREVEGFRM